MRECHSIFEGVPAAIVPDNLKAAVTRSDRNEPVINDDFAALPNITAVWSILLVCVTPRTRLW